MSSAPSRRALAVAVDALVKTNQPTPQNYLEVAAALQTVACEDFDMPVRVLLVPVTSSGAIT